MKATTHDRTTLPIPQANPITLDYLVPSSSSDPLANHINGHEHANVDDSELQYACTFALPTPRPCEPAEAGVSCACGADAAERHGPLCQPPPGGAAGTQQFYAQAYPGIRHLQVLKEFGENSIVASACPKVTDVTNPAFGYNPAIEALVRRVREVLVARCFPRPLPTEDDGRVSCQVIEVTEADQSRCNCAVPRVEVADSVADGVRTTLRDYQLCDGVVSDVPCSSFCLCELPQLSGEDLQTCQNDAAPPSRPGFCYLNAQINEPNVGNPELVADCSVDTQRLIRFVGDVPAAGSQVFVVCEASAVQAGASQPSPNEP